MCVRERNSLCVSVQVRHSVVSLRNICLRACLRHYGRQTMSNYIQQWAPSIRPYQSNANTSHALQNIHSNTCIWQRKTIWFNKIKNKWEIQMGKKSRLMAIHHDYAKQNHKRYMAFGAWDAIKLYHCKTSSSSSRFWCFKDNLIEYNPRFPGSKS